MSMGAGKQVRGETDGMDGWMDGRVQRGTVRLSPSPPLPPQHPVTSVTLPASVSFFLSVSVHLSTVCLTHQGDREGGREGVGKTERKKSNARPSLA